MLAKTGSGAVMEDEADGLDDFRKFYLQLDEEVFTLPRTWRFWVGRTGSQGAY